VIRLKGHFKMIRQRLFFAGMLVAVISVVASSGDVEARNCRCQGQRGFRQGNWGWRQNNGYYAQTNYAVPAGQPMTTPATAPQMAPDPNAPTPPSDAPAPAPTSQPSPAPTT